MRFFSVFLGALMELFSCSFFSFIWSVLAAILVVGFGFKVVQIAFSRR